MSKRRKKSIIIMLCLLLLLRTVGTSMTAEAASKVYAPSTASVSMKSGKTIIKFKKRTGYTIYYTINGKTPVKGKSYTKKYNYSKGITLTSTKTIKAVSYKKSRKSSMFSKKYTVYPNPKLNAKNVTLDTGFSSNLKVTNAKTKVTWSTSNKKVATVSSKGVITAKKAGTATIKAKVNGGTVSCKVTVKTHKHSYTSKITKTATCTQTGTRTYTCKCGKSYTEHISKKNHTSSNWKVVKEASYTAEGKRQKICTVCKTVLAVDTIAKLTPDSVETYANCREEMLSLVNQERQKAGLKPLELYDAINETAQIKAKDLYETGVFDHGSSNLGYFNNQYDKAGLLYTAGGENIAKGYTTVESVMTGWLNSQGHRANILSAEFTHLGVGYYKGYWVQQFIGNPKEGTTVACPNCDGKINIDEYMYQSTDSEGNLYGIYQCRNCAHLLEKCPKCEEGFFEDAGLTSHGSLSKKCNKCGHYQSDSCIENCVSCGSKILNNTESVKYKITADSTRTYDGHTYEKADGCYFQQFIVEYQVCKSCGKHTLVTPTTNYEEMYTKLKEKLGSETSIYECIFWEKSVGSEKVDGNGNTSTWVSKYGFVKTPEIKKLEELLGSNELSCI